jgi:ubiquinone biosynthesis protein UbiJ
VRWDLEEDLSRIVGDVVAHRLTQTGAALLAWHAVAASNLAQSLAEYWTEEQPLIASRAAVREFVEAVDALRDDAQRLEKRIERLSSASAPRTGA